MANSSSPASGSRPRLHLMMNGVFTTSIAGGDIHCLELARAASKAGYPLHFFGGYALKQVLEEQNLPSPLTLTDTGAMRKTDTRVLKGQFSLLADHSRRFLGALKHLKLVKEEDIVYAVSDYWFDVLPAIWCKARRKMMVWHMQAPSFGQILKRSRPDVDPARLASLHYCFSQNLALRSFKRCKHKRLFHVHPDMRKWLLGMGYLPSEIEYLSFGMEAEPPAGSEPEATTYDACWIGRAHRQKGIDDLFETLSFLAQKLPNFRAVLIGNVRSEFESRLKQLGLEKKVDLPGFVSETEKFKLFRSSRLYLMPSRFEGSPRVIGEAILCGLPVVAYDVPTYKPIFKDLAQYVPSFDTRKFSQAALDVIEKSRNGIRTTTNDQIRQFITENSWDTVRGRFLNTLNNFQV